MTKEEIREMVMQIGGCDRPEDDSPALRMFETFAKLVAAKERDACALICEEMRDAWVNRPVPLFGYAVEHDGAAKAIRARGEA